MISYEKICIKIRNTVIICELYIYIYITVHISKIYKRTKSIWVFWLLIIDCVDFNFAQYIDIDIDIDIFSNILV